MKFEEFERQIWAFGYGIVGLNHYSVEGKRFTYCAILNTTGNRAFREEGPDSEKVFESIIEKLRVANEQAIE